MWKFFWIAFIFGMIVGDSNAATVRELVNGRDPESQRFEKIIEVLRALLKRFFVLYRSSVMANSYYAEYNGFDERALQFNDDNVEEFTFSSSKSSLPSTEEKNEVKVNIEESESTQTTSQPSEEKTETENSLNSFDETTTPSQ